MKEFYHSCLNYFTIKFNLFFKNFIKYSDYLIRESILLKSIILVIISILCLPKCKSQNIEFVEPNKNTVWKSNETIIFQWRDTDPSYNSINGNKVNIFISYDDGRTWKIIFKDHAQTNFPNQLSKNWIVEYGNTDKCRIKIETLYGDRDSFKSDNFTILYQEFPPKQV